MVYAFLRIDESGMDTKLSKNLDEFQHFCHYTSLSGWIDHKRLIEESLKMNGIYWFNGNDVWYAVIQHCCWEFDEDVSINLLQ
jgi:hypothetical protein